jgi:hypothetical protein
LHAFTCNTGKAFGGNGGLKEAKKRDDEGSTQCSAQMSHVFGLEGPLKSEDTVAGILGCA